MAMLAGARLGCTAHARGEGITPTVYPNGRSSRAAVASVGLAFPASMFLIACSDTPVALARSACVRRTDWRISRSARSNSHSRCAARVAARSSRACSCSGPAHGLPRDDGTPDRHGAWQRKRRHRAAGDHGYTRRVCSRRRARRAQVGIRRRTMESPAGRWAGFTGRARSLANGEKFTHQTSDTGAGLPWVCAERLAWTSHGPYCGGHRHAARGSLLKGRCAERCKTQMPLSQPAKSGPSLCGERDLTEPPPAA